MPQSNSFVCTVTPEQLRNLRDLLERRGWEFGSAPYAHFRAIAPEGKLNLTCYESGKLVVQGKDHPDFVRYTLEPEILHTFNYDLAAEQTAPETVTPHCGVDESGKGDFFGPLVVASLYVTPESAPKLREFGVCDSKLISGSAKIYRISAQIRELCAGQFAVLALKNETYNRLYDQFGNLNRLLAWGHACAIENLLELVPECPRALSDKFGDERLIARALMTRGRQIRLEQRVRAESDVAVAGASILARAEFLRRCEALERELGVPLPRGCGAPVMEAARALFRTQGAAPFAHCAKLHFKTWSEVRTCGSC